jgi:hypothetical protein
MSNGLRGLVGDKNVCRNILRDHDPRSNDRPLANVQDSTARRGDHRVRADEGVFLDENATWPACVRQDDGSHADLNTALDFYRSRVFVFQVDIIPDENVLPNSCAAKAMQEWANTCCTWQNPGEHVKNSIAYTP